MGRSRRDVTLGLVAVLAAPGLARAQSQPRRGGDGAGERGPDATLRYGPGENEQGCLQCLDVWRPPSAARLPPVLVHVHGGAWRGGDKRTRVGVKRRLARSVGAALASVNYRLLPEASVADQADDLVAAIALLRRRAAELRIDPDRIALTGFSAGGQLAALVALDRRRRTAAFGKAGVLRGVVLIDPAGLDVARAAGLAEDDVARYERVFPSEPAAQDAVSALARVAEAERKVPFLVIARSVRNPSLEMSTAFVERLGGQGVDARLIEAPIEAHAELDGAVGTDRLPQNADVVAFLRAALG